MTLPVILNQNDIDKNFADPLDDEINDDEIEQDFNTEEETEEEEGKQVRIIGKYTQVDVRKLRNPKEIPPVYKGHAGVKLEDGAFIFFSLCGTKKLQDLLRKLLVTIINELW